jgi:hypothetical protein
MITVQMHGEAGPAGKQVNWPHNSLLSTSSIKQLQLPALQGVRSPTAEFSAHCNTQHQKSKQARRLLSDFFSDFTCIPIDRFVLEAKGNAFEQAMNNVDRHHKSTLLYCVGIF